MGAAPRRAWRLVLLGPPGVGKGTQAQLLGEALGSCALSLGDLFRAARTSTNHSPAMTTALALMEEGELVPDETVMQLVLERRGCLKCRAGMGFLLDGFPRTLSQAEALERILAREKVPLDAVLSYELPMATVIARLAGRRVCPRCKVVYHLESRPPRETGRCDQCGTPVVHRADDQPEVIRTRMIAYEASTLPLVEHYRKRGILVSIPADGEPAGVLSRTLASAPFAGHGGLACW